MISHAEVVARVAEWQQISCRHRKGLCPGVAAVGHRVGPAAAGLGLQRRGRARRLRTGRCRPSAAEQRRGPKCDQLQVKGVARGHLPAPTPPPRRAVAQDAVPLPAGSWPVAQAAHARHADRLLAAADAEGDVGPRVLGIDETRRGRPRWVRAEDGTWRVLDRFRPTSSTSATGTAAGRRRCSGRPPAPATCSPSPGWATATSRKGLGSQSKCVPSAVQAQRGTVPI